MINIEQAANKKYPVPRELDGVYTRIIRDGKPVNRCFSDLTSEEQERFMQNLDKNGLITLCKHLTEVMRSIADEFDISCKETEE